LLLLLLLLLALASNNPVDDPRGGLQRLLLLRELVKAIYHHDTSPQSNRLRVLPFLSLSTFSSSLSCLILSGISSSCRILITMEDIAPEYDVVVLGTGMLVATPR
jgi:hypothetical protein